LLGAGPIPTGAYEVLDDPEHPGQSWFRLDPIDSKPRNDVNDDQLPWRNGFRLHPGTISHGCITFLNGSNFNDPKDRGIEYTRLINILSKLKTKTNVIDNKKGRQNQIRTRFGTITVISGLKSQ
jgi:hypothetical protein